MPAFIDLQCLWVGMGLGCFCTMIDEQGQIAGTMLIDLGTQRRPRVGSVPPAVATIRDQLWTMPQPTIDLLVLTHSDIDHTSMLANLLAQFQPFGTAGVPQNQTLLIREVRYAGERANYTKYRANPLDLLEPYVLPADPLTADDPLAPNGVKAFTPYFTSFRTNVPVLHPFRVIGGAAVWILSANTAASGVGKALPAYTGFGKAQRAMGLNVVSVVTIIQYAGWALMVTGDATGATLAVCVQNMKNPAAQWVLANTAVITAPHHGSDNTTFNIFNARDELEPRAVAEMNAQYFADCVGAKNIVASAGRDNDHHLPGWRTLAAFSRPLEGGHVDAGLGDGHLFTAFFRDECERRMTGEPIPNDTTFWPPKRRPGDEDDLKYKETDGDFYTVRTPLGIFTNLYGDLLCDGRLLLPPFPATPRMGLPNTPGATSPLAVNWSFRVSAAGDRLVLPTPVLQQSGMPWGVARATPRQRAAVSADPAGAGIPSLARHPARAPARPAAPRGLAVVP